MMLRTTMSPGKDLIVWLDGHDETPKTYVMHKRLPLAEIKKKFGAATLVYLVNKNLQSMPRWSRGCPVWLQDLQVIGVIKGSRGACAHLKILHPMSKRGQVVVLQDMRAMVGFYLQYVTGPKPLPMKHNPSIRSTLEHGETLIDWNFCIKMSVEGPSVVLPPKEWREAEKEINLKLPPHRLCTLNTQKLERASLTRSQYQVDCCSKTGYDSSDDSSDDSTLPSLSPH
jgi:hypothetical protein